MIEPVAVSRYPPHPTSPTTGLRFAKGAAPRIIKTTAWTGTQQCGALRALRHRCPPSLYINNSILFNHSPTMAHSSPLYH